MELKFSGLRTEGGKRGLEHWGKATRRTLGSLCKQEELGGDRQMKCVLWGAPECVFLEKVTKRRSRGTLLGCKKRRRESSGFWRVAG